MSKTINYITLSSRFLNYLKPDSYILDLGCGSGRDSKFFISKGHRVKAIDGSKQMCLLASNYIGQEVDCVEFRKINYINEFDAIWACASLLHVNKNDIDDVIKRIYKALKNDGYFYCSFKYGNSVTIQNERYFNNLNEEQLKELIEDFEIVELWSSNDVRPDRIDKWINAIAKKT